MCTVDSIAQRLTLDLQKLAAHQVPHSSLRNRIKFNSKDPPQILYL
jgi:hypothetical protein